MNLVLNDTIRITCAITGDTHDGKEMTAPAGSVASVDEIEIECGVRRITFVIPVDRRRSIIAVHDEGEPVFWTADA